VPSFCDQDSVLYHKPSSALEEPKIFVPLTLREQIIRQHHTPVFSGHQGEKRTLSNLRFYYYWPSMAKDVERFIQKCTSCAKLKGGRTPLVPLGELPETTGPMEITSIDICGPYPITRRGNRYLLLFAISLGTRKRYHYKQEAETVARALVTQVFTRRGCPQVLSSDRGRILCHNCFKKCIKYCR
jgi:hypothetical protein